MSRLSIIALCTNYHHNNRLRGKVRAICLGVQAIYPALGDESFWCESHGEVSCTECPLDSIEKWENNLKCLD